MSPTIWVKKIQFSEINVCCVILLISMENKSGILKMALKTDRWLEGFVTVLSEENYSYEQMLKRFKSRDYDISKIRNLEYIELFKERNFYILNRLSKQNPAECLNERNSSKCHSKTIRTFVMMIKRSNQDDRTQIMMIKVCNHRLYLLSLETFWEKESLIKAISTRFVLKLGIYSGNISKIIHKSLRCNKYLSWKFEWFCKNPMPKGRLIVENFKNCKTSI